VARAWCHGPADPLDVDQVQSLVREARSRCPHLKALFTSGYARDAILDNGGLDVDVLMIGKPFTFVGVASRVRDVLDSTAA
jgi:hypothetical protein